MSTLSIPDLWKIGWIIPILKPNKSPDESSSYLPISWLSPLPKLMEKLVLGTLTEHLQLAEHQHGFGRMHSTTTALHLIHDHIQRGPNEKRPNKITVMVTLDISRAFYTVNIRILMKIILETTLPCQGVRHVTFRNITSKYRRVRKEEYCHINYSTYTCLDCHFHLKSSNL